MSSADVTALIIGLLVVAVITMGVLLLWISQQYAALHEDFRGEYVAGERAAHAKCVSHIATYVGDEFAAQVLELAASDWDSVEELANIQYLARTNAGIEPPTVPALWLQDRANRLREAKKGSS